MVPHDIDPSLCTGEHLLESLDDGFSPPKRDNEASPAPGADSGEPPELALGPQSPF